MPSIEDKAAAYDKLRKIALKTHKQLKEVEANTDRENPIDIDTIKTIKAMNYERSLEVIKSVKG